MRIVTVAGTRNARRRAVTKREPRMNVNTQAVHRDSAVPVRGRVVAPTVRRRLPVCVGGIRHVWLQPSVMVRVSLARHQHRNLMAPLAQTDKFAI